MKKILRIIGIEEESQLKGPGNIFNKIIEEKSLKLKKEMTIKIHETYRTPKRLDQKNVPLPPNNQNTKHAE